MSEPASETERETITIHELLERSARAALDLQREDGSFPPGRNGVYDEPETPVRTTSHWLTTLSKVYEITGDEEFAEAANDAADYLLSEEARPHGYTFHSRNVEGKDKCDGLVGQAAPIRSLAIAGRALDRSDLYEEAKTVFLSHPFENRVNLWKRREITGKVLSFDRTLNHQILFASSAIELTNRNQKVTRQLARFLDGLQKNLITRSNGLIRHFVRPSLSDLFGSVINNPSCWDLLLNEMLFHLYTKSKSQLETEVGYHPVNMDGLAKLKLRFPNHPIWSDDSVILATEYIRNENNIDNMLDSPKGSNVPSIRLARAQSVFHNDNKKAVSLLECFINDERLIGEYTQEDRYMLLSKHDIPGKMVGLPNYELNVHR